MEHLFITNYLMTGKICRLLVEIHIPFTARFLSQSV
jgi:hypothetical protein